MSNPSDYTVGWVCALTCEYVAAQEFLDEEHDPPDSLQPNDSNDYTLGRIGRHNVVIAVLPDGEYGTATAASVATSMLNSFPNVRIGLMVGIGGGAPSPTNDVRLGDIVVSAPREANGVTYGGVFEYDFGKTIQDQAFQETRFLNQPPTTLRAAVRGLQAQYARKGHQLGQAVSNVISKNPMLQDEYSRPNSSTDFLFRSDFTHGSRGCAEFCAKDPSSLVTRRLRTVYHDKPAIHYGIIASANQLMKNAITRDRLAKERNVLCFEMEAAGLMNDFPCLVIRGICDYSDSHKNKKWQGYAAMAAAAYAKDLLNRIVPSRIENEQRMSELFSTALHALENTGENVNVIKSRSDREIELEILNWLTAIDYGPQQSDIFRSHQPGTGQWVLDSDQYQTWIATKGKTLFCPGIPGAGKTIVASVVINHLMEKLREDPGSGLAYIYCDFRRRNEQTVEHFASSLLKQLAEKQPTLPDAVRQLHKRHKKSRTEPSLKELVESLRSVAQLFDHVFVVVDALDECQESNHCLPRFLSELFDLQKQLGVNVFATARPLGHIKSNFERAISIEIRAHSGDVRKYVSGRLGELPMIVQRNTKLQEDITDNISRVVDGMFLLAKLHFESLIGKMTGKAIRRALESLPTGSSAYDSAYEEAMNRIEDQNRDKRDMAKKTLLWITCAKERLTKSELQEALAVEIGEPKLDQDNLPNMDDVASVCAGLVTIDEESDVVRLVHYTTQDFFERTRDKWFEGAESHIAEVCLTYLLFEQFRGGMKGVLQSGQIPSLHPVTRKIGKLIIKQVEPFRLWTRWKDHHLPFYHYAAGNWASHVRNASMQTHDQVIAFLESGGPLQMSVMHTREIPGSISNMTGLYLAAYLELDQTVEALLRRGHNPNIASDSRWFIREKEIPLISASQRGNGKVVKVLLSGQANPNLSDHQGRTALWWAASKGYDDIVKLLIDKGANPDYQGFDGATALGAACARRDYKVAKVLLDGRANPNLQDGQKGTALWWAAFNGYDDIVKLLIDKGADPDHRDLLGRTALGVACEHGYTSVVKALLPGARIDLESLVSTTFTTPLLIAIRGGKVRLVEALLKRGDTASLGKDWSQSALSLAVSKGHTKVVQLLLRMGANAHRGSPPLVTVAARKGYTDIVEILLGAGVDPDDIKDWGYILFQRALNRR
ncbi:NACHT domain-containing protein [Fusarium keratoplasticum]|uniref:NACHT domain-containing protein n=1 Tax=Fusarium keratoplasticum TaxID=1328300 RepID=A0ACC0QSX4_9HYPO|nr:NACHT domain-containing protein [Fusarium keratoplasticum]KAI8665872.1 NACHT domain-containing protein [Fusarium keratoplasticum]